MASSWVSGKTSDAYTPALYLEPGKPPRRCNVKASKVQAAPDAIAALQAGAVCVFVAREDAGAVMEAVRGTDGETSRLDA